MAKTKRTEYIYSDKTGLYYCGKDEFSEEREDALNVSGNIFKSLILKRVRVKYDKSYRPKRIVAITDFNIEALPTIEQGKDDES